MKQIRSMSLLFLVLALAFFLVPEFRQGLQAPLAASDDGMWLERLARIAPEKLGRMAAAAEQQHDVETLAFVALRAKDGEERFRLAGRAASLDRAYTWLHWNQGDKEAADPHWDERRAKLQAWDADNAIVHLFVADRIHSQRNLKRFPSNDPPTADLAGETEWRGAMARVFSAPRYDSYVRRRFQLERAVFRRHGLDQPLNVIGSMASYSLPNLQSIRQYAALMVSLGREAEKAGRVQEALGSYWVVARFGEIMEVQGAVLIEKLVGASLKYKAYEVLAPALKAAGRGDEAMALDHSMRLQRHQSDVRSGRDPLAQSSNYHWSVLMVHFFAGLVLLFSALTLLTIAYLSAAGPLNLKRDGGVYRLCLAAQNYAPMMLFLACLALYTSYYPYSQNFRHYMTAAGEISDFEPFFYNAFPTFGGVPGRSQIPLGNPFALYGWFAAAGVALMLAFSGLRRRRGPPAGTDASRTAAANAATGTASLLSP